MRNNNKHLDPDVASAATLPSEAIRRFRKAATKTADYTFSEENGNEHQSKVDHPGSLSRRSFGFSRAPLQNLRVGIPAMLRSRHHRFIHQSAARKLLILERPPSAAPRQNTS
jgi:hypothetical protein